MVNSLSTRELYALALKGNRCALKSWEYFGETLGRFSAGLINLLNLELIILTGGLSNASRFFIKAAQKTIKQEAMRPMSGQVKLVKSKLRGDAGIIGAYELTRSQW